MNNSKFFFHNKNSSKVTIPGSKIYDFQDEIYINTFTLEDLYQITTIGMQQDENRLIDFMQSHISVDILQLTEADFKYLLFWERLNSYSYNPITLSWECKKCLAQNNSEINESSLEYKELNPNYSKEGLIIDLYSGEKIVWKIPNLRSIKAAKEFCKGKSEHLYSIAEIASCIKFHEAPDLPLKDRVERVKKFLPDDFSLFLHLSMEYSSYGIQELAHLNCKSCAADQDLTFHFGVSNVFPSFPSPESVRSRILPNNLSNESKLRSDSKGGVQQAPILSEKVRGESENRGSTEEQEDVSKEGEVSSSYEDFVKNNE